MVAAAFWMFWQDAVIPVEANSFGRQLLDNATEISEVSGERESPLT
jgi:hypothetical protein